MSPRRIRWPVTPLVLGGLVLAISGCPGPDEPVVATTIQAAEGDNQQGLVATPLSLSPAVIVTGDGGRRAGGVAVTFSVTGGGGSITGAAATTGSDGIARVGNWTLGSQPGTNELTAEAEGLGTVVFHASGFASLFNVEVRYPNGPPTPAQQQAFNRAAARWRSLIIGDLPDLAVNQGANGCHPAINETVDDLVIYAVLQPIDGEFGILGQAGPCLVRSATGLTIVGRMQFDTADLPRLETNGTLDAVILHEMGHVLGFGSLWTNFGLLADAVGSGGTDPHFLGADARTAFDQVGGAGYAGAKVPVANTGGPGSQDSHWRESVFAAELMTPVINGAGFNPLSRVTISSLADLGYATNPSGADAYTLGTTVRAQLGGAEERLGSDILQVPVYAVDPGGALTLLRGP